MEALKPLSEVQGVRAWALVGEDGFVLEAYRQPEVEVGDLLGGLGASVLATARAVAEELVLLVLLDQVASLGRARLVLKRVLPALKEELP